MTRTEHLLVILMEECAEAAQRASKAARFGLLECQPEQQENNLHRLIYELNDLIGVAYMIAPAWIDETAIDAKQEKVETFLRYSETCGTLSEEGDTNGK